MDHRHGRDHIGEFAKQKFHVTATAPERGEPSIGVDVFESGVPQAIDRNIYAV